MAISQKGNKNEPMRLLIITQKVDKNDDILGFFHEWIRRLSERFEFVFVICLFEGEHKLPSNVEILSLGKEENVGKITYIKRFYKYIWNKRSTYDKVFVHMNTEYIVLGGLIWKVLAKDIYLWFNHPSGNYWIRLIHSLPKKIFCTSKYAFAKKYRNSILMPAGIDTSIFKISGNIRKKQSILILGRLSPVKRLHVLNKAFKLLLDSQCTFDVSVYGSAPPQDQDFAKKWILSITGFIETGIIHIHESVPNYETPKIYNCHELYINLTPTGSFDKTILEAMACGAIPIVANRSFEKILPPDLIFKEDDSIDLAEKIQVHFTRSQQEMDRMTRRFTLFVEKEQSLNSLIEKFLKTVCAP